MAYHLAQALTLIQTPCFVRHGARNENSANDAKQATAGAFQDSRTKNYEHSYLSLYSSFTLNKGNLILALRLGIAVVPTPHTRLPDNWERPVPYTYYSDSKLSSMQLSHQTLHSALVFAKVVIFCGFRKAKEDQKAELPAPKAE